MNIKEIFIISVSSAIGIAACFSSGCAKQSDVLEEIVLESNTLRVVIRPNLGGRIMSFQAQGVDNILWTNKIVHVPMYGWINHGGEKTWIGPQNRWKNDAGETWPPPFSFDSDPYQVITQTTSSVTMCSQIDTNFNLAVQRQVKIAGNTLQITSKLISKGSEPEPPDSPITNWSVAQLPHADFVYVRLCGRKRFCNGSDKDKKLPAPTSIENATNILAFALTDIQVSGKAFFDADMFGLEVPGGCLLITHTVKDLHEKDAVLPERAQFYVGSKNDMPPGYEGYMELEFSQAYPDAEQCVSYTFISSPPGDDATRKIIKYMSLNSTPATLE